MKLQEVIDNHVVKTIIDCRGNLSRAAKELDIDRRTIYRMLAKRGLKVRVNQEMQRFALEPGEIALMGADGQKVVSVVPGHNGVHSDMQIAARLAGAALAEEKVTDGGFASGI